MERDGVQGADERVWGGGVARKDGERWNEGLGEGGWRLAAEEECERRVWECALTWR